MFTDIGLPHLLLSQLIDYDRLEKEKLFNESFFECEICFLSLPGLKCIRIFPCEHVHCRDCITSHISAKIADGDVTAIDCPSGNCPSKISTAVIKELIPPELFERFDSLLLQRTLDGMNDIVYCPRSSCQCVTLKEEDSNMSQCPRCRFAFCILCKRAWHGVSPCRLLPSDLKELRATYEALDDDGKRTLEKQYGKKKLEQAFQELDSSTWMEVNAKQCPNCNSNIQKTDGCNKMTCTQCRCHFCWLCDAKLPQHDPYGHFRIDGKGNQKNPCVGRLFEGLRGFDEDFWL